MGALGHRFTYFGGSGNFALSEKALVQGLGEQHRMEFYLEISEQGAHRQPRNTESFHRDYEVAIEDYVGAILQLARVNNASIPYQGSTFFRRRRTALLQCKDLPRIQKSLQLLNTSQAPMNRVPTLLRDWGKHQL